MRCSDALCFNAFSTQIWTTAMSVAFCDIRLDAQAKSLITSGVVRAVIDAMNGINGPVALWDATQTAMFFLALDFEPWSNTWAKVHAGDWHKHLTILAQFILKKDITGKDLLAGSNGSTLMSEEAVTATIAAAKTDSNFDVTDRDTNGLVISMPPSLGGLTEKAAEISGAFLAVYKVVMHVIRNYEYITRHYDRLALAMQRDLKRAGQAPIDLSFDLKSTDKDDKDGKDDKENTKGPKGPKGDAKENVKEDKDDNDDNILHRVRHRDNYNSRLIFTFDKEHDDNVQALLCFSCQVPLRGRIMCRMCDDETPFFLARRINGHSQVHVCDHCQSARAMTHALCRKCSDADCFWSPPPKDLKCGHCERNHSGEMCPSMSCFMCNQFGHTQIDCPRRTVRCKCGKCADSPTSVRLATRLYTKVETTAVRAVVALLLSAAVGASLLVLKQSYSR